MRSIRTSLLRQIIIGVAVVLLASGAATFLMAQARLRAQLDASLISKVQTFATLVIEEPIHPEQSAEGGTAHGELVFDFKGSIREADLGALLRIATLDGDILAQTPEWPSSLVAPVSGPRESAFKGQWIRMATAQLPDGGMFRIAAMTFHANREMEPSSERIGGLAPEFGDEAMMVGGSRHLVVAAVAGRLDETTRSEAALLAAIGTGAAIAAIGTAVVVTVGVGRGLHPLSALSAALDGVDPAGPTAIAPCNSCVRELQPIEAAINGLIVRAREALERERRFTDAAAHELRTPLAELRTITDVARRWPSEQRRAAAVDQASAIGRELEELLASLLAISRGQRDWSEYTRDPVLLIELVREILPACVAHQTKGVGLDIAGSESAAWALPRSGIAAVFRNLIKNALEYTPRDGVVRIAVMSTAAGAAFRIENGPVSISPEHVERLFEPFWRGDASRTDRQHCGLGLAIVDSMCEVLALDRRASIETGRMLRIELSLRHGVQSS
ncbi:MAG: HAMP domain-containing sensor histidine kinase [Phycisphaerae bacterium]|nr:HAMP domain-containing sensor histidine kinase [Phycisphaerae bacterium]